MDGHDTPRGAGRPGWDALVADARQQFEATVRWCGTCAAPFGPFEDGLWVRVMRLAGLLVRLFLLARHQRLDLRPHLAGGRYRLGDPAAGRQLRTRFGAVRYVRSYLIRRHGGPGYHP